MREEVRKMAGADLGQHEYHESAPPTGDQLALRLFGVVFAGVCAVIVLMVVMGGWGAA